MEGRKREALEHDAKVQNAKRHYQNLLARRKAKCENFQTRKLRVALTPKARGIAPNPTAELKNGLQQVADEHVVCFGRVVYGAPVHVAQW